MIHLDLHLPDGTVHGHLLDRDAIPRVGDHVDIDPDRTLCVARVGWGFVAIGPEGLSSHTQVGVYLEES